MHVYVHFMLALLAMNLRDLCMYAYIMSMTNMHMRHGTQLYINVSTMNLDLEQPDSFVARSMHTIAIAMVNSIIDNNNTYTYIYIYIYSIYIYREKRTATSDVLSCIYIYIYIYAVVFVNLCW